MRSSRIVAGTSTLTIDEALGQLSAQEEHVLRMRFGIGTRAHSLRAIAVRCGLSSARIREIELRALATLRMNAVAGDLAPWYLRALEARSSRGISYPARGTTKVRRARQAAGRVSINAEGSTIR